MNYLHLLKSSHDNEQLMDECPSGSRIEFLAQHIFGLVTYDSCMDELLGQRAFEVFRAISEQSTRDYIEDPEQYRWYIVICNMPFFANRLEWGGSIRGAWWAASQPPLSSCSLFIGHDQIKSLSFEGGQWVEFSKALMKFAAK